MTVVPLPTAPKSATTLDPSSSTRSPSRWNDPLSLIQNEAPAQVGRIVLWIVCALVFVLVIWASFGQLDIVATAEGKLVPQTLVKIVQPAEAGVVKQILVNEGDVVTQGQVLVRLDTTLAKAEKTTIAGDLASQLMQERRLIGELQQKTMTPQAGDDPVLFAQVQAQSLAKRRALNDALEQEHALLRKAQGERKSALEILTKLQQVLPVYNKTAKAYQDLEKEGFMGGIASAEKQREAVEKGKDLDAQQATVVALDATIEAQHKRITQLQSAYESEVQKELADVRTRIQQLRPSLDKSIYREGLMELRSPQAGRVKDLATTSEGAVVQPGAVVMTLVPIGENLYADVAVKNEDIGFVQIGNKVQIKLATYPFQKYGVVNGRVTHISADASETGQTEKATESRNVGRIQAISNAFKARIALDTQVIIGIDSKQLPLGPGMQIVAEIHQGQRTVIDYLFSPINKVIFEAARER